mgnify:FL=1
MPRRAGIGSHQSAAMLSDEWITPKWILDALGPFDLDPCCAPTMPWPTAARLYTRTDNGLLHPWTGRVWLNPPYSRNVGKWLGALAKHGTGTALVFARTETTWFHAEIWRRASSVLFLQGRLHFCYIDGREAKTNAGAPSVLVAYGAADARVLEECTIPGQALRLR